MYLVTSAEMKEMDRRTIEAFGIPGIVLMENAGRGAVDAFCRHFPQARHSKIGILAGRGNNGGDGFVIARYLSSRNMDVVVYLLSDPDRVRGDAEANFRLLEPMKVPVHWVPDMDTFERLRVHMTARDIWVDAMLGTGLKSEVRGLFKEVILFLNSLGKPIMAVDIPSGLDSDTGKPQGACIRATVTVTFGLPKIGHVVLPGNELVGTLEVVDIGIPPGVVQDVGPKHHLLTQDIIAASWLHRAADTHKGRTGHLLVIGGSPGKTGAAAMTSRAAMRVGAGLVTLGIPKGLNAAMESMLTEVMTIPLPENSDQTLSLSAYGKIASLLQDMKGLAIGPGLGTARSTQNLTRKLIQASPVPVVIDADGLNALVGHLDSLRHTKAPLVLTPHPGEMARLLGLKASEVQEGRIKWARDFAQTHQVHLVLKGAKTLIAHPEGDVYINPTGNPGMASGGMGDVLTGMIGGLIVQGVPVHHAVRAAVHLHGSASDSLAQSVGPAGFIASDLIEILPGQMKALAREMPDGPMPPTAFHRTL